MNIKDLTGKLLNNEELSRSETCELLVAITQNTLSNELIAAILTAIQMRGVTVDELLGFRDGILRTGNPVKIYADKFIDIVGTGGDQKNTFNISTCACMVVAGAGYKVVKHGNYASTSVSGASNVIEGHGVKFTASTDLINKSLDEAGFAYLHAPLFANAMKHVAPVRKALPFPTCFNLLGPLVNPAQPPYQLLGVANLDQMRLYSNVFRQLGIGYGIVNSVDGYDEISLTSDFKVTTHSIEKLYSPADLGMTIANPANINGGTTREGAIKIFDDVLGNRANKDQINVVIANAAYAIGIIESEMSIDDTIQMARQSLESGKALEAFKKFVEINQ